MLTVINPATEEKIAEYPEHDEGAVTHRLETARAAFAQWRRTPISQRAALLHRVAELLRQRRTQLAELMAREMGKPITAGEAEIDKCATCCDFYADHAGAMLEPTKVESDAADSYVRYDPIGPVLAIMPWNFPYWQVFRFAAPSLMAGNVAVLKHAPNVPGCALAIESLFADAGFPEGVFSALLIANERAQAAIEHEAIAAVTLTGSTRAGSIVASQAGAKIKKTVLELGGSDAFIVLADADVEAVAHTAAEARCINSGQSCIAAKRFIVVEAVREAFEAAFVAAMRARIVGDPLQRATQLGPLARVDLLENLERQVEESIRGGARLLCGGQRGSARGYFYQPTVLTNVRPGVPAFDDETFGPVAAVIAADDADHAVALANHSRYGLGASIWTRDIDRAHRLAAEIEAGAVFINGIVRSDPRLPFGGIKESGYGRELAEPGIREFVNIKSVWVERAG